MTQKDELPSGLPAEPDVPIEDRKHRFDAGVDRSLCRHCTMTHAHDIHNVPTDPTFSDSEGVVAAQATLTEHEVDREISKGVLEPDGSHKRSIGEVFKAGDAALALATYRAGLAEEGDLERHERESEERLLAAGAKALGIVDEISTVDGEVLSRVKGFRGGVSLDGSVGAMKELHEDPISEGIKPMLPDPPREGWLVDQLISYIKEIDEQLKDVAPNNYPRYWRELELRSLYAVALAKKAKEVVDEINKVGPVEKR